MEEKREVKIDGLNRFYNKSSTNKFKRIKAITQIVR